MTRTQFLVGILFMAIIGLLVAGANALPSEWQPLAFPAFLVFCLIVWFLTRDKPDTPPSERNW